MEFRLLGPVEVRQGATVVKLGGPRQRAVLAALALRANQAVSVSYLVDAVWEKAPASPSSNIRTYVLGLRRRLRDDGSRASRLVTRPPGYLLRTRLDEVDVAVFEDLADRGARALGQGDDEAAAECFQRALGLWRGQPLEGLEVGSALQAEVARLEERRLAVTEQCMSAWMRLGRHGQAVGELRRLVIEHPLQERLWAQLMLALYGSGRQTEALEAYQRVRRLLADELGVEPGEDLRRMEQAILKADPSLPVASTETVNLPTTAVVDTALRHLPRDIAEFTGRRWELRRLRQLGQATPDGGREAGTATVICMITGMAGVGKTRLAVHAARQITESGQFDEVQLHANLQGFTPDSPPAAPAAVLESFLRLLGVPGGQIPHHLTERAALYRDRLHGRRSLVLLDDAATEEQVRPLLPGGPSSLVLITSRRNLPGLDGAQLLSLDAFTTEEAVALLARIIGDDRVAAEPRAAARIAELCGHLPIAVTLAARRLQTRPAWALADLVTRLETADQRLSQLAAGTQAVSTTFDLSYQALPPVQRRMFRLLALHPGQDATPHSAAALADTSPPRAESLLEGLLDEHLLQQHSSGRYRFHDLMRTYAHQRASPDETPAERKAAIARVLGWYLHTADAAGRVLDPHRRHITPDRGCTPRNPRAFATHEEALAWFEAEHANLVGAVHTAANSGLDVLAWQLPAAMLSFFHPRLHRDDWIATHDIALAAAQRLGDQQAQAGILDRLGVAYSDLRRYDDALDYHHGALRIQREIGDRQGEAWTVNNLGVTYHELRRYDDALDCFQPALKMFRETGDRRGEGLSLANLADTYRQLNRLDDAAACLRQALAIQRETGDRPGQRHTVYSLGDFHRALGQYEQAVHHYQEALAIDRELGNHWGIALVLMRLGQTLKTAGRTAAAHECWHEALSIYDDLGQDLSGLPPEAWE